ncbi:hypothetical protein [Nonomuraea jabiensis]|uniref:hypothetical protein n=1 Tax=Nonomuraea jabiensis TaxID=882448 RepID=UPI003D74E076
MVGGRARSAAPRELAEDPQAWPHANLVGHPAAAVVQQIAAALAGILAERRLSLRGLATASGVNRQSIADLLAGRGHHRPAGDYSRGPAVAGGRSGVPMTTPSLEWDVVMTSTVWSSLLSAAP